MSPRGLDGDDYPSSVTGPDGVTTTLGYDRLGQVKTVTSSTGSTAVMEYDDDIQGTGSAARPRRRRPGWPSPS